MTRNYSFRPNYSKDDIDELISLYRKTNHETDLYFMAVIGLVCLIVLVSFFHDELVSTPFALSPFFYLTGISILVGTFLYISVKSIQLIKKSDEYLTILTNLMVQEKRLTLSRESRDSRKIVFWVTLALSLSLPLFQLSTNFSKYLNTSPQKYNLTITYPQNNAEVEHKIVAQGTYKDTTENKEVWVYVYGLQEKKYYPVKATIDKNNNTWQAPVQFGLFEDKGKGFEIGVILVEKSDQNLANLLVESENSSKGLYGFPLTIEKIISFVVKRK
ncbi:MAG: hypothetical protein WAQ98_01395 [Blastocatellia bacterium]